MTDYMENGQWNFKRIAERLVRKGTSQTNNGSWTVSFREIQEQFGLDLSANSDAGRQLVKELQQEEEINDLIMAEDYIEMSYHLEYCPACQQGGTEGVLSLLSLMGCNLQHISLRHAAEESHGSEGIAELNRDTLTEEGKKEWADILNAKVAGFHAGRIILTGCRAHRVSDFSSLLSGHCTEEELERWVKDPNRNYAQKGELPGLLDTPVRTVNLIVTYEELLKIPKKDRLTAYFESRSGHFFRSGVTESQVKPAYEKALAAIDMTDADYQEGSNPYVNRGAVIRRMRDCLLAGELKIGEYVLLINTEPYGGPGDFSFRGGIVKGIDPEHKTCTIEGDFFDMEDVPLHYILGRYNPSVQELHFGKTEVEVLFGETEPMALKDLKEAEETWEAQWQEPENTAPVLQC